MKYLGSLDSYTQNTSAAYFTKCYGAYKAKAVLPTHCLSLKYDNDYIHGRHVVALG